MTKTYRVYVNHKEGRVLVSGRDEDLGLIEEGWRVEFESNNWRNAYEYARDIADATDYILEWYLEEEVEFYKGVQGI